MPEKMLSKKETEELLKTLIARFEKNMDRHKSARWDEIEKRLNSKKLQSLYGMERTGGEPDVIGKDFFYDFSKETPKGRVSLCYDKEALDLRKENKPKDSAINMATKMGIEMLNEEEYRELQKLGSFDTKTSSWIKTPQSIRKLGGAIFADRRYNTIFVYHNSAESYYSSRGFRGKLEV